MAFEKQGLHKWYDESAQGDSIRKVVWRGPPHAAKVVTADGMRHQLSAVAVGALLRLETVTLTSSDVDPPVLCEVRIQATGLLCGRTLPCRFHS
jgi:hypothetical protein